MLGFSQATGEKMSKWRWPIALGTTRLCLVGESTPVGFCLCPVSLQHRAPSASGFLALCWPLPGVGDRDEGYVCGRRNVLGVELTEGIIEGLGHGQI